MYAICDFWTQMKLEKPVLVPSCTEAWRRDVRPAEVLCQYCTRARGFFARMLPVQYLVVASESLPSRISVLDKIYVRYRRTYHLQCILHKSFRTLKSSESIYLFLNNDVMAHASKHISFIAHNKT